MAVFDLTTERECLPLQLRRAELARKLAQAKKQTQNNQSLMERFWSWLAKEVG